jgi:hypothetical protein
MGVGCQCPLCPRAKARRTLLAGRVADKIDEWNPGPAPGTPGFVIEARRRASWKFASIQPPTVTVWPAIGALSFVRIVLTSK